MKKFIVPAMFALAIGFTSCGSDDNEDGAKGNCKECEVFGIKTSVCDNGDGTAKISASVPGLGESSEDVEIPDGVTFEEFADTQCGGLTIGN